MTQLEVVVVGAGPVGLTAACELRRRDIPVRVIDARSGPATTSRALGMHARTLEVLAQVGILEQVLALAQPVNQFRVHDNGAVLTTFKLDYSALGTAFTFSAFLDQAETERLLRERLAALGGTIEWGREVRTLSQDADGVTVNLADGEAVRAGWLVGADGGSSRVRRELGLSFDGHSDETWLVSDAIVTAQLPRQSIHMLRHRDGNVLLFPFPQEGKWRLLDTNPPTTDVDAEQQRASLERRVREATRLPAEVKPLTWFSKFTIQQRQTARMRVGRCLLAGDAAHVHSPASGQGMNVGIQDAFALAWRLAMVVGGDAGDALLDDYDRERHAVSSNLLASAALATRLIKSRRGALFTAFGWLTSLQSAIAPLHRRIEGRIAQGMSGLGLRYPGPGVDEGRRFPQLPTTAWGSSGAQALATQLRQPTVSVVLSKPSPALDALNAPGVNVTSIGDPDLRAQLGAHALEAWLVRPDGYLIERLNNPTVDSVRARLDRALHRA
jgi:NADPH-dependent dioxygenase